MQIITVDHGLSGQNLQKTFVSSCELHNLDLVVLEYHYELQTNRIKDILLCEYLKSVNDKTIILYTEASNTIFLAGEKELLRKFKTCECQLLFSAGPCSLSNTQAQSESRRLFEAVNPMTFIGYAGFLKYIYNDYPFFSNHLNDDIKSNQCYWQDVYHNECRDVKIDVKHEIFLSFPTLETTFLNKVQTILKSSKSIFNKEYDLFDLINIKNGRIQEIKNNSWPCHLSFAGEFEFTPVRILGDS